LLYLAADKYFRAPALLALFSELAKKFDRCVPDAAATSSPILKGLCLSVQRWTAGGKGTAVLRWENVGE
jgi:hypothetical protein